VIVINKSYSAAADVSFQIAGQGAYTAAAVYAFDKTGTTITQRAAGTIANNLLTYKLPPLTAAHFILTPAAPVLTGQPMSQSISGGSTVVFTASATSASSYQWRLNGTVVGNSPAGASTDIVSGANGPQLVISDATAASAGSYTVVASNSIGLSLPSGAAVLSIATTSTPGYASSISSRAFVGTGDNILIGGFYIVGGTSRTVLIQAIGPALAASPYDVAGVLQHPALSIHQTQNGQDVTLYTNDGWGSSPVLLGAAATAYAQPTLQPGSADSELLVTLPPGGYTAEVSGADGGTGVALCAIYQLP